MLGRILHADGAELAEVSGPWFRCGQREEASEQHPVIATEHHGERTLVDDRAATVRLLASQVNHGRHLRAPRLGSRRSSKSGALR